MIQHLTLFLTPDPVVPQATLHSPPAVAAAVPRVRKVGKGARIVAGVVGNAAGFGLLLAGSWFSLQLMSAFVV